MKDLVILAADKDMEHALTGLLARPRALGIRPIAFDVFVHPEHDPGCALRGATFLSNFAAQYLHGLILFDHEGSGRESGSATSLQESVNAELSGSPWGDRAQAIVVEPELEAWIWSDSPHVEKVAGWEHRQPGLRRWLAEQGWIKEPDVKPSRPKEAFQAALRVAGRARSASLYRRLAENVSVERCTDSSFQQFKDILQHWFSASARTADETASAAV